jgi:hypothetical protein
MDVHYVLDIKNDTIKKYYRVLTTIKPELIAIYKFSINFDTVTKTQARLFIKIINLMICSNLMPKYITVNAPGHSSYKLKLFNYVVKLSNASKINVILGIDANDIADMIDVSVFGDIKIFSINKHKITQTENNILSKICNKNNISVSNCTVDNIFFSNNKKCVSIELKKCDIINCEALSDDFTVETKVIRIESCRFTNGDKIFDCFTNAEKIIVCDTNLTCVNIKSSVIKYLDIGHIGCDIIFLKLYKNFQNLETLSISEHNLNSFALNIDLHKYPSLRNIITYDHTYDIDFLKYIFGNTDNIRSL